MTTLTIDDREISVPAGSTLLQAAQELGIDIPTLCFSRHLKPYGGCRVCLVEASNARAPGKSRLVPACAYPVEEGLVVRTTSERVQKCRKFVIELLLQGSRESEELNAIARKCGVSTDEPPADNIAHYLAERAPKSGQTKCIKCGLCVRVCSEYIGMSATCFSGRGSGRTVKTPFDQVSPTCIGCGACAYLCPTKAIRIEAASE